MASTSELEKIGRKWLDATLKEARKGAYPGRTCRGDTWSPAVGKTREDLRSDVARGYEWFLLNHPDGGVYGVVVTIVFPVLNSGGSSVNAEVFDHDSGTSIALSQPAKKGIFGWKTTDSVRSLGAAESLQRNLVGPTVRYELGNIELEERRRLLNELSASGIPNRTGPGGGKSYLAFVPADKASQVTAIPGWPPS